MNRERYISNFNTAIEAIFANKFRAILTALGIIFGVAAVIAMLAIGNGAKKEILEQVELIGLNNIVIKAKVFSQEEGEDSGERTKGSDGLRFSELEEIGNIIDGVVAMSPEIELETNVMSFKEKEKLKVIGVSGAYFDIKNMDVYKGQKFAPFHITSSSPVCIIGSKVEHMFFGTSSAIGKQIKVKNVWLQVIGVLKGRNVTESAMSNLGIENMNKVVYIPYTTMLNRIRNRKRIDKSKLESASDDSEGNDIEAVASGEVNYHEIDQAVIQLASSDLLSDASQFLSRYLFRKHNRVQDFEIQVPQHLLEQQQKTKDVFNIVLGAIAGISLVVGGIGIMNIMLASVYERIKEIGLRIALGAFRMDIIRQFLFESVLICVTGGITGIILGIAMSYIIEVVFDIETIISFGSIFLSFFVAVITGLIFGIAPARKAASQNPISSLRHD